MSLVGPRPFPDYHLSHFSADFLELRQRVRPGITGLWQVAVRSEGPIEQQESLDTYYIRNWSIWLDLYILVRTVKAVLGGRGAY
jgi:lipopolysaccharide/colanic/teichoic acid biosynthesis glycosyltransferase